MIFKPISVDPVISEGIKKKTKQWLRHWSITRDAGGLFPCLGQEKKGGHRRSALASPSPSPRYVAGRYVEGRLRNHPSNGDYRIYSIKRPTSNKRPHPPSPPQKNNNNSDHWSFRASQEGNRKLHRQDPRQYQNNRATEDRPPWNCSHTQEDSIHQIIQQTYDCPRLTD